MSEKRKVSELRLRPKNAEIYGGGKYEHIEQSIREIGRILEPLVITKNDLIINGGRRWTAAQAIGITEVPVRLFDSDDELDILEAIVHFNRQRLEKNAYEKAREASLLAYVARERRKRKMAERMSRMGKASGAARRREDETCKEEIDETQDPEPTSNYGIPGYRSSDEEPERTREEVAKKLEVSEATAERLIVAGDEIGKAEQEGNQQRVEELKEKLNTRGVKPVFREIREARGKKGQPKTAANAAPSQLVRKLDSQLAALRKTARNLAARKGGEERVRAWCEEHTLPYEALMQEATVA